MAGTDYVDKKDGYIDSGDLCSCDDYTDPAPATTFAHLDATTNLERRFLTEQGIYPAVDPLESSSSALTPKLSVKNIIKSQQKSNRFSNVTVSCRILSLS